MGRTLGAAEVARKVEFSGRNYVEAQPLDHRTRPSPGFGAMNPAAAQAEISRLKGDPAFMERYNNADDNVRGPAVEQMKQLFRVAENANLR
jgi:hypothetical protein